MAETLLARWRRIHGVAEFPSGVVIRNDAKEDVKKEVEAVVQKKDAAAQTTGQGEEVPAWAANFMQTTKDALDSMSSRMDEISAKNKGGVPEVEDGQDDYERTMVAKDALGEPAESAANGDIAARKFREAEEAEEHAQAEYAGQGESPVTATESEQERLQRSKGAGPEDREYNRDLENGVNRFNTQGQERSDLRGHGEDKTSHHSNDRMDALYRQQEARLKEMEARLNKATRMPTIEERNAVAAARKRADSVYSALGRETPEWLHGESPASYRRRLADGLKDLSSTLKKTVMDSLPEDVFGLTEERIYADAMEATKRSDVCPPMQLRPHKYTDETGHQVTEYHGDNRAWMAPFMAPGAVTKIDKNAGRVH